ncbi:3-hydroxyacyl-CoA dehydrogenase family protein [Actinomadura sp. WMMB 499]|uniref:3-hydroxyacyl-CoA dehydrogenase family protein n=1 Tax=Actinomadura sp. WMMB 499 TaxID=1219491 RepID=UPI0012458A7A|nr:3-hydroxyacyl-CoA dehydrogenase NAD-binding domain-containing protein [Actinomadura sp. WMMB 499]QFG20266.1 3-hydroxyacyl-CoA dehydrogenase family protein [Actinomadura sp. WMMB 499]
MSQHLPTVAVVGPGTAGSALIAALAAGGLGVLAVARDDAALRRGRRRVLDRLGDDAAAAGRVTFTTDPGHAIECGLVVEALPERDGLKERALAGLGAACAAGTVLATTATGSSITGLASAAGRVDRLLGLRPAGTSALPTLLEIAHTPFTGAAARAAVEDLVDAAGLARVTVGDRPGFVAGGLMMAYLNAAVHMHERRYATPHDIETAMMLGCGLPRGPLAELDRIGLDTVLDALTALHGRTGDGRYAPAPLLRQMVAAGLLGDKSGRGFLTGAHPADGAAAGAGTSSAAPAPAVSAVGIIGTGTMAAGIAEVCVRAGHPTTVVGRTEVRAKEAVAVAERSLHRAAARGLTEPGEAEAATARLGIASDPAAAAGCDVVIEAVAEDAGIKTDVFAALDRVCRPGTLLASTTSSLPVIGLAMATSRPEQVVGLHFFNPAPRMRLVEVVRTVRTSGETERRAHAFCAALGKRVVGCADRTGFIVNALLFPYLNQAAGLLADGYADADGVDLVMNRGWGYPMGPLRLLDTVGLDVSLAIQRSLHLASGRPSDEPARVLRLLVSAGLLGRKSGRGFHPHGTGR